VDRSELALKEKAMFKFLRRIFAGAAPESKPPLPDILQAATADTLAQIFEGDVARLEAQSRGQCGGGAISFNHDRRR
jgi:hypothetical protein